ncbi:MAG: GAF domain-containing protein, partial [Nakamurella sp.]
AGEDPARYAHLLRQIRDAALSGARSPAAPRPLVDDSWRRAIGIGMDPDHGRELAQNVGPAEVEFRRHTGKLARVLPVLGDVLMPAAEDAGHVMVVVDAMGIVLWRDGPKKIQQHAARLGFEVGANWSERSVGTNAIGTALVVSRPVQIYSAEHFVKTHHAWTCAAAPILDPANGNLLGVVDVSGAAATVHPSTLALVDAAARMAESFLREEHHVAMGALRALAGPLLAGSRQPTIVTDADGWVAAASTGVQIARIALPEHRDSGPAWLPAFGACRLEPIPGGWLVRVQSNDRAQAPATEIGIDLRDVHQPSLSIQSQLGHWSHRLSPRHAELLLLLALNPSGSSAGQLSCELYGSAQHAVAVRAEISRLRKHVGGVLDQRPYRFADGAKVHIDYPTAGADLLPASTAPTIRHLRSTRSALSLINASG